MVKNVSHKDIEKNNLNKISHLPVYSNSDQSVMALSLVYCADLFKQHMVRGSVLELGPGEGFLTKQLLPEFPDYTVVDAAQKFIDNIQNELPGVKAACTLFEDYMPEKKADNIILGHVLEHVEDPVHILKLCQTWLSPRGRLFAAVPNSDSIHRQAAVKMGLLHSVDELNETDKNLGHRRVYNPKQLLSDFEEAGLAVISRGGYMLKPLSNKQIESSWSVDMIEAFLSLGEKYPDIAAEIYVIAANKEGK